MAEEVQVLLHHSVVLPCEVQGYPRPTITWQREGVPVATGWFGCSLPVVIEIGLVTSLNYKTGNINILIILMSKNSKTTFFLLYQHCDSKIMYDTSAYIRILFD